MDGAGLPDTEAQAKATECPVCSEDYTDPKLLRCNHLVCRKCVIDWLTKAGREGGCPLCRHPILPTGPTSSRQDDLDCLVDALPTDLTMVGLVEGCKILSGRNVCMHCDNSSTAATAFCLQCSMKLCANCANGHRRVPTLRNHKIKELNELTPERLAEINRSTCKSHEDRTTEMYCADHQELICTLCAGTKHKECLDVKDVEEAARERRAELREETQGLREMETVLVTKIGEMKAMLAAMTQTSTDVLDHLQTWVDARRQELLAHIQAEEGQMPLLLLDADRATVKSNADVIDSWMETAPDEAFLEMTNKMRPRLDDLKRRVRRTVEIDLPQVEAGVGSGTVTRRKSTMAALGRIRREASPAAPKPTGTITHGTAPSLAEASGALAVAGGASLVATGSGASSSAMATVTTSAPSASVAVANSRLLEKSSPPSSTAPRATKALGGKPVTVLRVGDRVKRGPHWNSKNEDGQGQGTVLAAPSKIRQTQGSDPEDFVDVLWDHGLTGTYRMGRYGRYDLQLVPQV